MLTTGSRVYLPCLPYYIDWSKDTYPNHTLPPLKTYYVLQAVHSIQGTHSAGNEWYELSREIFKKMGMKKNAIDNAVFTFCFYTDLLILLSKVDDLNIMSTSKDLYCQVRNKIKTKLTNCQLLLCHHYGSDKVHIVHGLAIFPKA